MLQTEEDKAYARCLHELRPLIPEEEYQAVLLQDECELEYDFLGFIDIYKNLSELIPKSSIVIDFGCYLAAQSYFFVNHRKYIGVDVVDMQRFSPPNATHYIMSIQRFLQEEAPKLFKDHKRLEFCAICSYVPDFKATEMVRAMFPNVFCYYPCGV